MVCRWEHPASILQPKQHLLPSCPPSARQWESLVNLSLAFSLTPIELECCLQHTLMAGKTTVLTISSEDTGESEAQYKADAAHIQIPQMLSSHLTASSFYLLVMLRCSSPFLPFPCRSITMSYPCFLLDGSQLPDFRHKTCISILTFSLSSFLLAVILQQFSYRIF